MKPPCPEMDALRERWRSFLAKIEATYEDTVAQTEEELLSLVRPSKDGGIQPFINAWNGIKAQLMGLSDKIDRTWQGQVRPKMQAVSYAYAAEHGGWTDEAFDELAENQLGTDVSEGILEKIERLETVLNGKAALRVLEIASEGTSRSLRCQECQADLEVEGEVFIASYVTCQYCNRRNTYEPSTDLREVAWFAVDHLARYRALPEWDALQEAHEAWRRERVPIPEAVRDLRRAAHRAYHERVLAERIKIRPELAATYEKDLGARIQSLHE